MASAGCEGSQDEWMCGGLYISDLGVLFASGEADEFSSGLVPWAGIRHIDADGAHVKLSLQDRQFQALRLQLSIPNDREWIEEYWKLRSIASVDVESIEKDESVIHPSEDLSPASTSRTSLFSRMTGGSACDSQDSVLRDIRHSMRQSVKSISSYMVASPPSSLGESLHEGQLPELTLAKVRSALEGGGCVLEHTRASVKAMEPMESTPWLASKRVAGSLVRRVTCTVPVPQDIPKALSRIVSLPDVSRCTKIYRLHFCGDKMTLTNQSTTHDITFGENFRVVEEVTFEAHPSGGVEFKLYCDVVWVTPLPWTHKMVKAYIEKKSKETAVTSVACLREILLAQTAAGPAGHES